MKPLHQLTAAEALVLLRRREITSEALVRDCLARIAADEPRVGAWEHLDPELALAQARRVDATSPPLPLAGLPVGLKDIIDTADLPTECNSPIYRGRRPDADAPCVAALRAAGAVILGKTVTTEFAFYHPGKTRNPHDPARTPGGSSSGSAAAVADFMVPAALGTQTAGSVIRPASFCGVVGMKPSHGLLPLAGVSPLAPSLDTLGLLTRAVDDLPPLLAALGAPLGPAPVRTGPPRVGLCRTEQWRLAAPETRDVVERAAARLARSGAAVTEIELPADMAGLPETQRIVMAVEAARTFHQLRRRHEPRLSQELRKLLDEGESIPPERFRLAVEHAARSRLGAARLFGTVDVLLTPSAIGEAPEGLASTGDPAFNRIWTVLHLPCVNLPGPAGPSGLPIGVQLVGPPRGEALLVDAARWVAGLL